MLSIRTEQMKVFEQAASRQFEDEMLAHSKEFSQRLCEVLGDDQLRVALRLAIARATTYGFTYRGPIRLFIEMTFLCGSAFDTDPQYPMFGEVLRGPGDQMQRAEQIHEGHSIYLEKVSGPKAINVHNALRNLALFSRLPLWFSSDDFVPGMLQEIQNLFPQKAAYAGTDALAALIQEGRAESRRYGFPTPRGEAPMVVLMFAFGHGCTNDPLYPWISSTLRDDRLVDPAARAARLEKKALTWLEHVNARSEKRAAT